MHYSHGDHGKKTINQPIQPETTLQQGGPQQDNITAMGTRGTTAKSQPIKMLQNKKLKPIHPSTNN
jgi:hypothetical protein